MQLSRNFKLSDFTKSSTALKYGIINEPNSDELANIQDLVNDLLQPLRNLLNKDTSLLMESGKIQFVINITSGFRCKQLNSHKDIGGSPTSDHVFGRAADIQVPGLTPKQLALKIVELEKNNLLDFDQVILEPTWVHLGYRKGTNRSQVLTCVAKGKYQKGIL